MWSPKCLRSEKSATWAPHTGSDPICPHVAPGDSPHHLAAGHLRPPGFGPSTMPRRRGAKAGPILRPDLATKRPPPRGLSRPRGSARRRSPPHPANPAIASPSTPRLCPTPAFHPLRPARPQGPTRSPAPKARALSQRLSGPWLARRRAALTLPRGPRLNRDLSARRRLSRSVILALSSPSATVPGADGDWSIFRPVDRFWR